MSRSLSLTPSLVLLAVVITLSAVSAGAADEPSASSEKERELLAVLRSDAPASEKAVTCKKLAIHGSSAAVPELAKWLSDPSLSSWARIALEAIPGPAADEALRKAAESLDGLLLVGTINSIGVRQDGRAVELLTPRLQDSDAEVASAAAVALGRIGNAAAIQSLRGALTTTRGTVRSAVAEGCVLCAERLWRDGKSSEAAELYDEIRRAEVPKPRVLEATRGAVLARGQAGIPLLLELLQSPDKALFQLALGTAREFPGSDVDQALAGAFRKAAPDRAALIILAMADRPKTVDLPAVLQAAGSGPKQVRLAALGALGRLGDASCLATLLEAALEADADLSQVAKTSLAELPSEKVDAQLVARLPTAEGKSYPLLIELIGQRRIDAVPELLKAMDHSDPAVRRAALIALGETVTLPRLPVLVTQVVSPKHPQDAAVAQQALKAAAVRMPDREACAAELATALERSPAATKVVLLEIVSEVGGTKALQTLAAAAKSSDPSLQDHASRLLGRWNSVDAAPVLLDLAKSAPEAKYQVRALRGYIGLARKFAMPEAERVAMCQAAFQAATQPAEQKLVLDVLTIHPGIEGLKFAVRARQVPSLREDATRAMLVIAQKIGSTEAVKELLAQAGLDKVKLEIIKAQYGSGSSQTDVTSILRKQAGDLPLIPLPAASYNASFGGDPLPGSVKQLKIQYRANGKPGEATFAENALIILPVPE